MISFSEDPTKEFMILEFIFARVIAIDIFDVNIHSPPFFALISRAIFLPSSFFSLLLNPIHSS